MAYVHGKKSKFSVDNAAGSLTELSAYLDEVGFPRSVETAEVTTFGDNAKEYIVGLSDATISISGKFDAAGSSTPDVVLSGILGQDATVTFEYQPNNAAVSATNPKYSGEAILTSYEVSSPVGDVVTFSAEFQVSGAITRTAA